MNGLPPLLRKLPYLFYALALIMGGWRFVNEWSLIEASYAHSEFGGPSLSFSHFISRSAAIYWGLAEAIYIVSSGAFLQVLIAIHDKMKGPAE